MIDITPAIWDKANVYFALTYALHTPTQTDLDVTRRYRAGATYQEIAPVYGVTPQRIRQRHQKMLRRIRAWWAQSGQHQR